MTRQFSFYGLLITSIAIGVLFYRVIEPFLFALLFALVLAVLFRPAYVRLVRWLGGRPRVAAGVLTAGVLGAVLVPIAFVLVLAGIQLYDVSQKVVAMLEASPALAQELKPGPAPRPSNGEHENEQNEQEKTRAQAPSEAAPADQLADQLSEHHSATMRRVQQWYHQLPEDQRKRILDSATTAVTRLAEQVYQNTLGVVGNVVGFVIGIVVIVMALYYLLADGEAMLVEAKRLLPLEEYEVQQLADQFGILCRSIVLGTIVAGLVQACLALIGYLAVGVPNPLLLFVVTVVLAFLPVVGATMMVMVVAVWLAIEGRYWTAALLFLYGAAVVSTCDNLIRAYLIGVEAKMNPLLVFITVIGALQLMGLWGIFVGPMVAAFFYTLVRLLHDRMGGESGSVPSVTNG